MGSLSRGSVSSNRITMQSQGEFPEISDFDFSLENPLFYYLQALCLRCLVHLISLDVLNKPGFILGHREEYRCTKKYFE